MKCRLCQFADTKVLESREGKDGNSIRRRRECQRCHHRFTTFEKTEEQPVIVVKRSKERELFDRQKLLRSMVLACRKRSVNLDELKSIADWVERTASVSDDKEVTTTRIGELVLDVLRHLDEVAYVRFASVYRAYESVEDFATEIQKLSVKPPKKQEAEA
jgi:transcriptional repressor NrdR